MNTSVSNILYSPLDIYQVSKKYFPFLEAKVSLDTNNHVTLILNLSKDLSPFCFKNAVDQNEFSNEIGEFYRQFNLKIISRESTNSLKLDIERFSIKASLLNWQKFRRVMYENEGHSCIDTIMNFLQNSSNEDTLNYLGLSPSQVEENITDSDFDYFRSIPEKLQSMEEEIKQSFRHRFQEKYPNIFRRLLDEMYQEERQKSLEKETDIFKNTLDLLQKSVLGQEGATRRMAAVLTTQQSDAKNKVFLFVGPTGVGKTELAKAVSKTKNNRLVTCFMNQCQSEMDYSKFFGSSSGYVGSTDKPYFVKEIEKYHPVKVRTEGSKDFYEVTNIVLLFDEFEKAHPLVKQSMLTLFDEGYFTVSYTEGIKNVVLQYNFKKSIIINTSNLYQKQILESFFKGKKLDEISDLFSQLNNTIPNHNNLSPELLSRMEVIPFGPISKGKCYQQLIKLKLVHFVNRLKTDLSCREVTIEKEEFLLSALERKLYGKGINIRKVQNFLEKINEIIYSNKHNLGRIETKKIIFSYEKDAPCIRIETFNEAFECYHDANILLSFPDF